MSSQLKYFEGKICSILTEPVNRNFREEATALNKPDLYPQNVLDHYTGRVVHTDATSVVIQHPLIGTRTYFRLDKIIGIVEEQEFDPSNPEHAKIIEQYKASRTPPQMRAKVSCPNGHELNVPHDIPDGSEVKCPVCESEFVLGQKKEKSLPQTESEFVDVNMLKKLSEEAKKLN